MNAFIDRLAEEGAKLALEALLVGLLTLIAAVLARSLARRGKVWVGPDAGRTCTSPYVLLVALLCAVGMAVFLALGVIFPDAWQEPNAFYAWLGLIALFGLISLAILPFTRHTWQWDEAGLHWQGAWRNASMQWPDIARLGKSWDARFFAEDKAGRRIYWSTYTLEHEALLDAIKAARPDLDTRALAQ
jgi:hypothetical protein